MKKLNIYWLLCLLVLTFIACNDDENEPVVPGGGEEEPKGWWTPFKEGAYGDDAYRVPPGPDYVPQGKYNNNLNVVYYVPVDSDTVPQWHKRLSGVLMFIQEFYKQQMISYGLGDKTFRLVLNKQNPAYVKIVYIKSNSVTTEQCEDKYDSNKAQDDILRWFMAHPEEKAGNHFLIIMPGESADFIHGAYRFWTDGTPLGMCMVAYDHIGLSVEGFYAGQTRVGNVMHELGHAFFLQHNSHKATQLPKVALMNYGSWEFVPGKEQNVFLTRLDAMWLNEVQPFNEEENNYTEEPSFRFVSKELTADQKNIYFKLHFTSSSEVEGVGVYNDPWSDNKRANDENSLDYTTEYDAVSYYVCGDKQFSDEGSFVREGENYEVSVVIPWEDLEQKYKLPFGDYMNVQAEIRYRIIFKGGRSVPDPATDGKGIPSFRSFYQIHNEMPDIAARYLDRTQWTAQTTMGTPAMGLTEGTALEYMFMAPPGSAPVPVIIDMKEVKKIRALFLQPGKNAARMVCIKVEGSTDGVEYKDLLPKYYMMDDNIDSYEAVLPEGDTEVRYLRISSLKGKNPMTATFDEISVFPSYN